MTIKINSKPKPDLGCLSIEAAEEIERTRRNISTKLKSTKELSKLFKESNWRLDYLALCSNAYFSTYSPKDFKLTEDYSKQYMSEMTEKLDSVPNLEDQELKKLVEFCCNFSEDHLLHQQELQELRRGSCFLVA